MESRGAHRQRSYGTRPNIIVTNKMETHILTDVAILADGNVKPKLSRKETKIQEFMYRGVTNLED